MKYIVHKAEDRGSMNIGWLNAKYSFSFARYYDPNKLGFGYLRVLNDDIIAPSGGFDTHPHDNMEIITIPLRGALAHKDSTGGQGVITNGEVQVMSAGTGVYHSEFNASDKEEVNLLQIWIHPKERNIKPRYDQRKFDLESNLNNLTKLASNQDDSALWINQNAELLLGQYQEPTELKYSPLDPNSYVYLFLIDGEVEIKNKGVDLASPDLDKNVMNKNFVIKNDNQNLTLKSRDAIGILHTDNIELKVKENSKFLLIDMDMTDALKDS